MPQSGPQRRGPFGLQGYTGLYKDQKTLRHFWLEVTGMNLKYPRPKGRMYYKMSESLPGIMSRVIREAVQRKPGSQYQPRQLLSLCISKDDWPFISASPSVTWFMSSSAVG